jgi:alkylation response protein AidB-like acyl-CoA dehydrogenase
LNVQLGFPLTEEQELIAQSARSFAQAKLAPGAHERDVKGELEPEIIGQLAELGLLGVKVDVDDGGAGADMASYVFAIAAVSEACASTGVTMAVCNLAADILGKFASPAQKEQYLHPLLAGTAGAATFCLSEPECGSDASALRATATKDGDEWVLNGTKQWITNGGFAGVHIVFAKTSPDKKSHGISAFLVPGDNPGVSVGKKEKKMGLRASSTVQLVLEDCRVPESAVLGEVDRGYAIALSALAAGRIGIAAQCIGIGEAALKEGARYALERKAFGAPIAKLGAIQDYIADSATDLEQAWLLTLSAAARWEENPRDGYASSIAKLAASEGTGRIVDRMLQVHGGYGYVEEYPIERLYRDARVTRIYEGTSEVQRIVIAREALRE